MWCFGGSTISIQLYNSLNKQFPSDPQYQILNYCFLSYVFILTNSNQCWRPNKQVQTHYQTRLLWFYYVLDVCLPSEWWACWQHSRHFLAPTYKLDGSELQPGKSSQFTLYMHYWSDSQFQHCVWNLIYAHTLQHSFRLSPDNSFTVHPSWQLQCPGKFLGMSSWDPS